MVVEEVRRSGDTTGSMTVTDTNSPSKAPDAANDASILAKGRAILSAESTAIGDAASRLGGSFVDAVRLILACRGRVCLTGVGKAGLIGHKIQATLASTGTLAYSIHPVEALHGDLGMLHPDDIIVALSKSGGSELVHLLPRLRDIGCRVILLTAHPESPAADYADLVLHIGDTPEACPLGLAPSSSTAAMLALGDALALCVMELKAVQPEQYASYHPGGALGRFLMKASDVMRTDSDCPTVTLGDTIESCYAAILAAPRRSGAAAVVDGAGRLVGFVTHGDFFRLMSGGKGWRQSDFVTDIMTRDPKRVRLDAPATEALDIMKSFAIDELPVVDERDRLVGMIDIQDLVARGFSAEEDA